MIRKLITTATLIIQTTFVVSLLMTSNLAVAADIDLGGSLMNKTITWFGQDFFNHFAGEWRNKRFNGGDTIVVEELPSARNGTQVVIRYKGNVVFQASISSTRSISREIGADAVPVVLSRLQDIELQSQLKRQDDLYSEEF